MKIRLFVFFICIVKLQGQSVMSSSYSQFGLGSFYETDFGSIPSIGGAGVAISSNRFINNLNPASLSAMGRNDFFFELGGNGYFTTATDQQSSNTRNNVQFSHLSLGFPVGKKSGMSVALMPYTNKRFQINNYELTVGNSDEIYLYNYNSSGGLTKAVLAFGKEQTNYWRWGFNASALFGTIETSEVYGVSSSISEFSTSGSYKGFQFQLGSQWKICPKFTLGNTLELPAKIQASQYRSISTSDTSASTAVVTNEKQEVTNFYFPLKTTNGINYTFKKDWSFSLDYTYAFWKMANNSSDYGTFKNQQVVAFGCIYQKSDDLRNTNHWSYSAGIRYDTGYLNVNQQAIPKYAFSLGLGIPLDRTKTQLNLNYSYGIQGSIQNDLIRENYHKIGITLSYNANWFVKRKYD